ncbi:unnamed protein product [Amoebophrya sp. A25]|nr:unnamed protein product [Amoebophrya sp. A25]|eukprot:GSA25T00026652001.1
MGSPHAMRPGDQVLASENANILPGNCLPLGKIPVSSVIHNVEFEPGRGGQVARAAGAFAVILDRCARYSTLKLSSTEIRKFHNECWASVGQVSNIMHDHRFKGKAGVNRRLGIRPCVRGNAQNPSRHPHGGGERAKSEKAPPRNVYSKWRQGMKTRDLKQPLGLIIHRSMNNRDKRKFAIRVRTRYKNEWCKIKILRKKRTRVDV